VGKTGAGEDFLVGEAVALYLLIPASEAAVKAILLTSISELNQSSQTDIIVPILEFHLQAVSKKALHLSALSREENLDVFESQGHTPSVPYLGS
jgi:hypothetical protein